MDHVSPDQECLSKMDAKYPPPKLRKGVTMTRNFPPNCGEDSATFSNVSSMENSGKGNSETVLPCKLTEESNDKILLESLTDGNLQAKDEIENESACVMIGTPRLNFQDFCRRNDLEITQGEVEEDQQWQSGNENHKKSNSNVNEMMGYNDQDDEDYMDKIMGSYNEDEDYNIDDRRIQNHDENVPGDLSMVPYVKNQVQEALKLFKELYDKLCGEYKEDLKGGKVTPNLKHFEAAMILKKEKKWVNTGPIIGSVPGIEVGDTFYFRAELVLVGLHHQFNRGINCVTIDGKEHANSVVDSGRYENKVLSRDVILYSGQGGNPTINLQGQIENQKLQGVNLALKRSMDANLPIRVIRKITCSNHGNYNQTYIYEGLYHIRKFWKEKQARTNKLAFIFEMVRVSGQPEIVAKGYSEKNNGGFHASDLSQGKEEIPIRVVNDLNNEKPQPFTYINEMKYSPSCLNQIQISKVESNGCDCTNRCLEDIKPCCCADKNGGEIPFNEQGCIIRLKPLVHECGMLCKCPPSCQNRVGQRGPRFQLEVFTTKSTGWGVRSREEIPSGSFICEYIGELLLDNEAGERSNDEYLFDLGDDSDHYTIDAAVYGNVARFINHCCSPNLYAQNVVYDSDDRRRLPHVMLFATKKIPAFQELCFDYNYKVDNVCDSKGKIKKKICLCGSRKCTGRMY